MVDWLGFILAATSAGWSGKKTKSEIYASLDNAAIDNKFKNKVKEKFDDLVKLGYNLWM